MTDQTFEPIIEPDLPIIDSHHHLWFVADAVLDDLDSDDSQYSKLSMPGFRQYRRYLLDEIMADISTGHNIRATVFIEAHAMYRMKGPQAMKAVGEVEFANGIAAMAASGAWGGVEVAAGIIGNANLRLGDAVKDVLLAQMQAGGDRYRGVRNILMYDEDTHVLTHRFGNEPHIAASADFRAGFKHLAPLGLSYEAWLIEPQLGDLVDLARAFPDTIIVANHTAGPVGLGRFTGTQAERFPIWRESIRALANCPNVMMKLGGLGQVHTGFKTMLADSPPSSAELAAEWGPYIEACIEAFGVDRCMFESNFPVDKSTASYAVTWNAFKRTVSGASADEKRALFSGTAARVYKIEV